MSDRPFRFLHASDFRLDVVPRGLTEVPDHLRDSLLDAPYAAARAVFDAAISQRVDFVILAGNILQPDLAGPRGTAFLLEQFQRLATACISVYWAGGPSDPPEAWPAAFPLPENVHVFPKDRVTDVLHQKDGSPLARIAGTSRGARALHVAEFSPDAVGLFTIGVACGELEASDLLARGDVMAAQPANGDNPQSYPTRAISYWALGGRAERSTLFNSPGIAHYPGTPQGRSPAETGGHGCTLVNVDSQGHAHTTYIDARAMEWMREDILIDSRTTREGLEAMFSQRIRSLSQGSRADLLVTWTIGGAGPLVSELRRGKLRSELLEWLRIEHGLSSPVVWTVAIELEAETALPASLYEQETILGDFLRTLREFELNPAQPLELGSLLGDKTPADVSARATAISDPATRKRVLHEAALLGMELLGGDAHEP